MPSTSQATRRPSCSQVLQLSQRLSMEHERRPTSRASPCEVVPPHTYAQGATRGLPNLNGLLGDAQVRDRAVQDYRAGPHCAAALAAAPSPRRNAVPSSTRDRRRRCRCRRPRGSPCLSSASRPSAAVSCLVIAALIAALTPTAASVVAEAPLCWLPMAGVLGAMMPPSAPQPRRCLACRPGCGRPRSSETQHSHAGGRIGRLNEICCLSGDLSRLCAPNSEQFGRRLSQT
jgi:hypothetical protein